MSAEKIHPAAVFIKPDQMFLKKLSALCRMFRVCDLKFRQTAAIFIGCQKKFFIHSYKKEVSIMGQQHNKIEKRNRRKAYLTRVRERIKALIKK